ncbi:cell number regulator 13-like isoform X2 [Andrographis paniculata]|uniref:cell number regulator 13-like isoform X2 n=1 Tax=Andrographis paniculata TaxID=175694 RepID=UPI0021E7A104|nr:cell number regulator 13-like isoform X2 [Andrographis paniculata]
MKRELGFWRFSAMASWEHFGEIANVLQLSGLNAVALIGLIVKAANTARMHKKNCRQFAQHVKLIGNLLEQLRISELKKYPESREPLEQLEEALRRAYVLVNSCQERSYLYLMAMGWNIVYQFRRAQEEIDRYLRIIPLITLLDNARVKGRLEEIQRDQREYTLDEEDRKMQVALSENDTIILKKSLSCSYPNLPFNEALKKERDKLQVELQRSQSNMDVDQCKVIERLMEVTENASIPEKDSPPNPETKHFSGEETARKIDTSTSSSYANREITTYSGHNMEENWDRSWRDEWHADLLGCCSEPLLCAKTIFCPCDTFSKIATVATGKHISSAQACNDIMAYSLILSCCCYTCCIRRKLRRTLNIQGGWLDDFLSHVMCCCCALIQEWREVEIRGSQKVRTSPPAYQEMD